MVGSKKKVCMMDGGVIFSFFFSIDVGAGTNNCYYILLTFDNSSENFCVSSILCLAAIINIRPSPSPSTRKTFHRHHPLKQKIQLFVVNCKNSYSSIKKKSSLKPPFERLSLS